jgi:hypothetical protein
MNQCYIQLLYTLISFDQPTISRADMLMQAIYWSRSIRDMFIAFGHPPQSADKHAKDYVITLYKYKISLLNYYIKSS